MVIVGMMAFFMPGCGGSSAGNNNGNLDPEVKSLKIEGADSITAGLTTQLNAIATLGDGSAFNVNDKVNWTSSNAAIAAVDAMGVVTGVAGGNVVIAATAKADNSIVAMHKITVSDTPVKLAAVKVTPAHTYVLVGASEQYKATAIFDDGATQDVTATSTWNIEDTSIAVINDKGKATGVSEGNVALAASYTVDGIVKTGVAKLDVLVNEPTFVSLTIEGNDIVPEGISEQLEAIAALSDGTTYNVNDKVNWTSSNDALATVDAAGVVTGLLDGDVTITATAKNDNTIVATHNMTVVEATLVSIQIEDGYNLATPQPITTLNVPITTEHYITAWGIYSDGTRHYINKDTFWWSSDQLIASMNSHTGLSASSYVYGRDLGTATITANYGGLQAELAVTVLPQGPALESIELVSRTHGDVTNGSFELAQGSKEWITAYGHYAGGIREDINRHVLYSSSDINVTYVIDAFDSYVRGKAPGTAVINVRWQGKSADINVTVTPSTIEIQEGCSLSETAVIDAFSPLEVSVGEEKCINAWLVNGGSKERITTTVFWESQTPSIASMDPLQNNSRVTGVAVGSATVSATIEDINGTAPVRVSAYIPGTIRISNFVDVDDRSLVVATPPTSATGRANGTGGFYYTASTDGTYSAGDLIPNTDFEYTATMGTVKLFVNIYTKQDTNCPTGRISIGERVHMMQLFLIRI